MAEEQKEIEEAVRKLEELAKQMEEAKSEQEIEELMKGLTEEDLAKLSELETAELKESSEPEPEPESKEERRAEPEPEPVVQAQKEEEEDEERKEDPILRQLAVMSEEERTAWAIQNGTAGVLKLLELQRLEFQRELDSLRRESVKPVLQKMLADWTDRNKELLQDEVLQKVALGLDRVLMEEAGKEDWTDFTPTEFQSHLQRIEDYIKKLRPSSSASTGSSRPAPSVGDLSGGVPPKTSPLEMLERVAEDPVKLEQLVSKMKPEDLDQILAQLD